MVVTIQTQHVFKNLPETAKPEDILLVGETPQGSLIIDYRGEQFVADESDCSDVSFNNE